MIGVFYSTWTGTRNENRDAEILNQRTRWKSQEVARSVKPDHVHFEKFSPKLACLDCSADSVSFFYTTSPRTHPQFPRSTYCHTPFLNWDLNWNHIVHNNSSVHNGPHIQWWSHKIVSLGDVVTISVCVSSLCNIHTMMKSPNDTFLRSVSSSSLLSNTQLCICNLYFFLPIFSFSGSSLMLS